MRTEAQNQQIRTLRISGILPGYIMNHHVRDSI